MGKWNVTKLSTFLNKGYTTFTKLFKTSVWQVLEYGSEIWWFKENMKWVQQRAAWYYYLGVHPKAPLLALTGDIAQLNRHIKIIKYRNRLINMDYDRLTKKVFLYDKRLCVENWSSEIKYLCNNVDLNKDFNQIDINTEECFNKISLKLVKCMYYCHFNKMNTIQKFS